MPDFSEVVAHLKTKFTEVQEHSDASRLVVSSTTPGAVIEEIKKGFEKEIKSSGACTVFNDKTMITVLDYMGEYVAVSI